MDVPAKPLKWYRRLANAKGRLEAEAFAVEGKKAISQIIAGHADEILEILTVDEPPPDFRRFPVARITESQCRYVSSTQTPQGAIAIFRVPEGIYSNRLPENPGKSILLLDGVQDPGNTGTLIRTAAAFDFSGIIMSGKCADPLSPKCVQAAAGTTLSVWIRRTEGYVKLAQQLKISGFTTLAADIDGDDSPSVAAQNEQLILALGNEAAGLSKEILDLADYRLYVPIIRKNAESLNVAACGAILMYLSTRAAATNQPR